VPVAGVEAVAIDNRQNLQLSTVGQLARGVWDKAIDQSVVGVFGLVNNARGGIDGDCLVIVASHRLERYRVSQAIAPSGRHLKVVTVILHIRPIACLQHSLFAGDPGAPGGWSTGTVA